MINKKNLWFLTLFSLILVLSVYYITMPNELLLTNNSSYEKSNNKEQNKEDSNKKEEKANVEVSESNILEALRVNLEEERSTKKAELQKSLTDSKKTSDEKNEVYEQIKLLNSITGQEESLESKIKEETKLDSFVQIDGNNINVVIDQKEHDSTLANKIMRTVQKEFKDKVYISVKFGK